MAPLKKGNVTPDFYKGIGGISVTRVTFSEIPEEGLALSFTDSAWIPEDVAWSGPVRADVFLERKDSRVILKGTFSLVVRLNCDRCLEEFDLKLEKTFSIDFELCDPDESEEEEREYQYHDTDMDTMFLATPEIDVTQVIEQQVLLSFPMKRLCKENCLGLCPQCGANLNDGPEVCGCKKDISSPFGVLARLKK